MMPVSGAVGMCSNSCDDVGCSVNFLSDRAIVVMMKRGV